MKETGGYSVGVRRVVRVAATLVAACLMPTGVAACGDDGATLGQTTPAPSDKAETYRLNDEGTVLVDSSRKRFTIVPKSVTGYVDAAQSTGTYLDMSGWAAPSDLSEPADVVVALVGRKSVATSKPHLPRPDLVDGYNRPGLEEAGFVFSVPKSSLRCASAGGGLRTYAIAGDSAAPMKWLGDVREQVENAC